MKLPELFTNWAEKDSGFTEKKQLLNRNACCNYERLLAAGHWLVRRMSLMSQIWHDSSQQVGVVAIIIMSDVICSHLKNTRPVHWRSNRIAAPEECDLEKQGASFVGPGVGFPDIKVHTGPSLAGTRGLHISYVFHADSSSLSTLPPALHEKNLLNKSYLLP